MKGTKIILECRDSYGTMWLASIEGASDDYGASGNSPLQALERFNTQLLAYGLREVAKTKPEHKHVAVPCFDCNPATLSCGNGQDCEEEGVFCCNDHDES